MEKRHRHHVVPRHKGGSNDPENLMDLDFIEHAQIHAERFISGEDNWFDCRHEGWPYLNEDIRQKVKHRMGELNRKRTGEEHGNFGRNIHTPEFRERRSREMTGEGNPMFGVERPDTRERLLRDNPAKRPEVKEVLREKALGRVMSEETRQKISNSTKGKPKSQETREAMKKAWEKRRNKN